MPHECLNGENKIYFKKETRNKIHDIKRIIFDFDGVLADTSKSYKQAIRKVVDHYFLEFLCLEGRRWSLVSPEDIDLFKSTGNYNNDWNLTYSILSYYIIILMEQLRQKNELKNFIGKVENIEFVDVKSFTKFLKKIGGFIKLAGISIDVIANIKNDKELGIKTFLARCAINFKLITQDYAENYGIELAEFIRKLVPYDTEKPDLLKRLFEEAYLGRHFFEEFYGLPSIFKFKESLYKKETIIPKKGTLEMLNQKFGKFSIYSEKPRNQGIYLLTKSGVKRYFDENTSVFLDDLINPEMVHKGENLGKPNPTVFIQLLRKLVGEKDCVAYVGDSIADVLLIRKSRRVSQYNILFLGVLSSAEYPKELLLNYIKHEADVVMKDVNDMPSLF
jgi:phosphoglycolate phosphatase-like HAD superfamily hydrolase